MIFFVIPFGYLEGCLHVFDIFNLVFVILPIPFGPILYYASTFIPK